MTVCSTGNSYCKTDGTVVFLASLGEVQDNLHQRCWAILSNNEKSKIEQVKQDAKRDQKLYSRALLRKLLGRFLKQHPSEVGIHSQSGNKPKLVEDNGIHFNVSHSKELIFIAISSADVVGVDVERVSNRSLERLVPRLFSNKEKLEFLNEADKLDFFYRYWTLKESIIKAVGKGHQLKLNEIDIARIRSTGFCYQEYECQFWGNNWESRSYCFGDYRWSISMPHGSMPAVIEIEQNEISNFLGEI